MSNLFPLSSFNCWITWRNWVDILFITVFIFMDCRHIMGLNCTFWALYHSPNELRRRSQSIIVLSAVAWVNQTFISCRLWTQAGWKAGHTFMDVSRNRKWRFFFFFFFAFVTMPRAELWEVSAFIYPIIHLYCKDTQSSYSVTISTACISWHQLTQRNIEVPTLTDFTCI